MNQADRIRQHALTHHVEPARSRGQDRLKIRAGDVSREMGLNRVPNICNALRGEKFLQLAGLKLLERIGHPQSTTTIFHYALNPSPSEQRPNAPRTTPEPAPSAPKETSTSAPRSAPRPATGHGSKPVVVIQCAASKRPDAGYMVDDNKKPILFVARPDEAPPGPSVVYQRPDDRIHSGNSWWDRVWNALLGLPDNTSHSGNSWRSQLREYNNRRPANPLNLLPAWQLYDNPVYGELVEAFGLDNVFILSAGWGLLAADFLTPNYDITFSAQAERYKRRRQTNDYRDFQMLAGNRTNPIIFLGGRDYVNLFLRLTRDTNAERIIYHKSSIPPDAPGCHCIRYNTASRNWHYECASALIRGDIEVPS